MIYHTELRRVSYTAHHRRPMTHTAPQPRAVTVAPGPRSVRRPCLPWHAAAEACRTRRKKPARAPTSCPTSPRTCGAHADGVVPICPVRASHPHAASQPCPASPLPIRRDRLTEDSDDERKLSSHPEGTTPNHAIPAEASSQPTLARERGMGSAAAVSKSDSGAWVHRSVCRHVGCYVACDARVR
jgi:hypothetical protein